MPDTEQAQHRVHLDHFEGPLDLLIFLIRKNEVNIYDIPIARITEQYLEIIQYAARSDLDTLTDFYLMAATLLHIKSRMLLPAPPDQEDDEIEDPRRELVEKLIEYQKFRKLSDLMTEKHDELEYQLERRSSQTRLPFDETDETWEQLDVWDLLKTFSTIVQRVSSDRLVSLYEEVTVHEKLTLIDEYMERDGNCMFTDLIKDPVSVMEFVCAFIAILESARQRTVRIMQSSMFGDIRLVARPAEQHLSTQGDVLDYDGIPDTEEVERGDG